MVFWWLFQKWASPRRSNRIFARSGRTTVALQVVRGRGVKPVFPAGCNLKWLESFAHYVGPSEAGTQFHLSAGPDNRAKTISRPRTVPVNLSIQSWCVAPAQAGVQEMAFTEYVHLTLTCSGFRPTPERRCGTPMRRRSALPRANGFSRSG